MSIKKENKNVPPDKLALYDRLVETIQNLERKGSTMPYTSLNGHMFSFLAEGRVFKAQTTEERQDNKNLIMEETWIDNKYVGR